MTKSPEQDAYQVPPNDVTTGQNPPKKGWGKRFFRISYFSVLHLLAGASLFFMFTALAVKF